jgi:hypothetical protein
MIASIGIQVLVIAVLTLTLMLVCYTVYVRVRQSTFTEKHLASLPSGLVLWLFL